MGTIRKGGKGAFFGEAGSFIGSNWPDINYILGIPPVEFSATSLQKCNNQYTKHISVQFILGELVRSFLL